VRKIIDGKIYDTDTAKQVGSYDNGLGRGDFRCVSESLYVTPKGNFFLDGEGGAMTIYGRPCGNMTSGGSGLFPMSRDEALSWMEKHGDDTDIIDIFGDLVEEA
jgi:hypothetical protein